MLCCRRQPVACCSTLGSLWHRNVVLIRVPDPTPKARGYVLQFQHTTIRDMGSWSHGQKHEMQGQCNGAKLERMQQS